MTNGEEGLPKEDENKLDSIEETLREILVWTRFANIGKLKEILEKELDTDEKKLAYENSDGENGLKEIAAVSGAPLPTVGVWWPRWFRLGIVTESEIRKGRMEKIVSLDDVGIKIQKKAKTSPETPSVTPPARQTEPNQPPTSTETGI
jgi:hypothetical protein